MKIVNRETFLSLPGGTLYAEYRPCYTEGPYIKGRTVNGNDYEYADLISPEVEDGCEYLDVFAEMQDNGTNVPIEITTVRDAMFNKRAMFAIYDTHDIGLLIEALSECHRVAVMVEDEKSYKGEAK